MLILVHIMQIPFFNDLHKTLKADFIMANPPFNLSNWGQEKLKDDVRWKYGIPPAGNANYAWIQHMIHHLGPNGKSALFWQMVHYRHKLVVRAISEKYH